MKQSTSVSMKFQNGCQKFSPFKLKISFNVIFHEYGDYNKRVCTQGLKIFFPADFKWKFCVLQNKTRGLLGTFNFDYADDFVLPDGTTVSLNFNTNNFKSIHDNFGMKCKF